MSCTPGCFGRQRMNSLFYRSVVSQNLTSIEANQKKTVSFALTKFTFNQKAGIHGRRATFIKEASAQTSVVHPRNFNTPSCRWKSTSNDLRGFGKYADHVICGLCFEKMFQSWRDCTSPCQWKRVAVSCRRNEQLHQLHWLSTPTYKLMPKVIKRSSEERDMIGKKLSFIRHLQVAWS